MSKKILDGLKDSILVGNVRKAKRLAEKVIDRGIPVNRALEKLMNAMRIVDERYERKEYFVVDVASSASAMREAFRVLEPYLEVEPSAVKGRVIIGSLKGNVQGLGKDIVAATLQSAGFQVVNLGVDVSPRDFVEAALREKAQVLAISISMEETLPYLEEVVNLVKERQPRDTQDRLRVVIGGNAASEKVIKTYGLDAYAEDARDCVKQIEKLLS